MMQFKISLKNVLRHKWSSSILLSIFSISSFIAFWIFGFSNSVGDLVVDWNRTLFGDLMITTNYFDTEKMEKLLQGIKYDKLVYERMANGTFETVESSEPLVVTALTQENQKRWGRFLKPVEGRIPQAPDEVMLHEAEINKMRSVKLGDTAYMTVFTPKKIINTLQFKVVGINRFMSLIGDQGMDTVLNSTQYANRILIYTGETLPQKDEITEMKEEVTKLIQEAGIEIKYGVTIHEFIESYQIYLVVLDALKGVILIFMFPLIGAVVGVIVWMHAQKRRKEIWTYASLGLKDFSLNTLMLMEYWIIGLTGSFLGIIVGFVSAYFVEKNDIWLNFAYTVSSPVIVKISGLELFLIPLFIWFTISIWASFPLRKIIRAVPFSY